MKISPRRLLVFALATLVVGAGALAAWGLWTSSGSGAAPAAVGSFAEPGAPSMSVTNGTVTLTWSAAAPPGAGTVDYQVERFDEVGLTWADACGTTPTVRITATTCADVPGAGTYSWRITAYYRSWTVESDASDALDVDDPDQTAPTGSVTAPAAGDNVRASISVTSDSADDDSGVASARFQRAPHGNTTWTTIGSPDTVAPYSVVWDTTAVADGLYDLRVITTDNVGNSHTSAVVANVRVDNTAPTVALDLASGANNAAKVGSTVYFNPAGAGNFAFVATVTDTGSGAASATYPALTATNWTTHTAETVATPAGGPFVSTPFTWSSGADTPAAHTVTVTDAAGNTGTGTVTFAAETTAPTGSVTAPVAGANVRGSISVTSDSADDDSGVASAQFQTSPAGAGTWSNLGTADVTSPYSATWTTTTFADGLYDLQVVTTDNVGNVFTSAVTTDVRVDNTAPTVALTLASGPTGAFKSGTKIYFKANAAGSFGLVAAVTDAGSGPASATYPVQATAGWSHAVETVSTPAGGPFVSSPLSWSSAPSTPGAYTVTVADAAGNTATSAVTFTVDSTAPTGAVTAPIAAANVRGSAVTVTSSSTDATSGVASAQFQTSPAGAGTWSNLGAADTVTPYATTWDTTGFADGLYDLRVITIDNVGNPFTSATIANVRVDNTAPTGAVTAPATNGILRGAITMSTDSADGGSGITSVQFQRSPAGTNTWTAQGAADTTSPYAVTWTSTTSTPDGLYDLRAVTTDKAGNTFTSPVITNLRVDNTAPTGAVTAPAAAANVRGSAVNVTSSSADAGSGVASAQFQISNAGAGVWSSLGAADTVSPYATTWDTTTFTDGLYDLRVVTTDVAGNVLTSATIANVRVDNTAPTGSITAPVASANIRATFSVTSNSADTGGSGVASALFQRSPSGTNTWTNVAAADTTSPFAASWVTTGVTDGLYDLQVITTDKAGNQVTSALTTVRVDNTVPAVTLTMASGPTGAFKSGTKIYFKANAAGSFGLVAAVTDAGSGPASATYPVLATVGWTHAVETVSTPAGGPFASSAFTWTSAPTTPGSYTVTVADAAGNTATSAVTFTVDSTAPTGAVTAPAAAANVRGSAVNVTSSSTDAGAGVASAQFQISAAGAGTWSNLGAADTLTPYATTWDTTTGFADGLYDLRVITVDNVGNTVTSATIANVRVDNTAPTGAVTAPATNAFVSGASVAVTANSADTGGSGVASAQFQTSPRGAGTWTNLGAADTTSPYSVTWNTTSGFPDGLYDLSVVTTDKSGNSVTSTVVPVEVQNAAPTVIAVQLADGGGTTGRAEAGDRLVVTYSETLGVATLCSTWSGNLTAQSLTAANDVTVTLTDGGVANDTLTVTSATCTFHLGTVNLGATGYVTSGNTAFGGSGASASSIAWDPATRTLTVTLGAASGVGTLGTIGSSAATYTPDSAIKNAVGTAISGTFTTGVQTQL